MRALTQLKCLFIGVFATLALSCGDKNTVETPGKTPGSTQSAQGQTANLEAFDEHKLGKKVFKRCKACHTLADGAQHKVGPNLWGVMGAKAGTRDGFKYSKVMAESGLVWTDDVLKEYLRRPSKFMPGNKMSFAGLRKEDQLDAVIAYLHARTQSD